MTFRSTFARLGALVGTAALATTLMGAPASATSFGSFGAADNGTTGSKFQPGPVEDVTPSFKMAPPSRFGPYDNGARPTPRPPVCDIYGSKYSFVYGAKCVMPSINPPPSARG